jgi:hypothetical protein
VSVLGLGSVMAVGTGIMDILRRSVHGDITTITLILARLMASTDLAGLWVAYLSALALGITATGVAAATTAVRATDTVAVATDTVAVAMDMVAADTAMVVAA